MNSVARNGKKRGVYVGPRIEWMKLYRPSTAHSATFCSGPGIICGFWVALAKNKHSASPISTEKKIAS